MTPPAVAYFLGLGCIALGLNCFFRPEAEYPRFGVPLATDVSVSPFIYLKGLRETTYGLMLIALQYYKQETALTIVVAIISLAEFGDGGVVWSYGGDDLRWKASGHLTSGALSLGWALWRMRFESVREDRGNERQLKRDE